MKAWMLAGITCLLALLALQALAATASCKQPDSPPTAPDGGTASREEMVAAQGAMKAYNVAVGEYSQCLQKVGGSAIELNRVVNQLEKLAERFNAELRKFKQRSGN